MSGLPQRSQRRADLTNAFVDELWNSLQHPPLSYLGDKYTYRQADGSYNVSNVFVIFTIHESNMFAVPTGDLYIVL